MLSSTHYIYIGSEWSDLYGRIGRINLSESNGCKDGGLQFEFVNVDCSKTIIYVNGDELTKFIN